MRVRSSAFLAVLLLGGSVAYGDSVQAPKVGVATASVDASRAAISVMKKGGNAIDGAVAAALALSVAEPQSSGIGGGGFALIYDAKKREVRCLDFRERAPVGAHSKMYYRDDKVAPELATTGALAVGVPGQIAGLHELHKKYGKRPIAEVYGPAIELAQKGVTVSGRLGQAFAGEAATLSRFDSTRGAWTNKSGRYPVTGETWVQSDLAKTLKTLRDKGPDAFYRGDIGKRIIRSVIDNGGVLSGTDLADYSVRWLEPVTVNYRGHKIVSMPPPSSGGVHIAQMLNMLENADLKTLGYRSPQMLHLVIESMRRAFADRAKHLGDPAFTAVPVAGLIDKKYAKSLFDTIVLTRASSAASVKAGEPQKFVKEHTETTHLSIIDEEGNAVVLTTTVNGLFGAALVAGDTGILLNNEMDDFAIAPGVANQFGLVGSEANAVAPRKTPLSSMSPTLVFGKDGALRFALGSPGGPTIITTVLWSLINLIDFDADLYAAISAPRVHQQWLPDVVMVESLGLDHATVQGLNALGHKLSFSSPWGNAQAVGILPDGQRVSASDPRGNGAALGY